MLEIILLDHKKEIKNYLIMVALIYMGLIAFATPILMFPLSNFLFMDDRFSGDNLSYIYLFASLTLMVFLVLSTSFTTFWMSRGAGTNHVLHQVYFFLFSVISASAASAFIILFLLIQLVALVLG